MSALRGEVEAFIASVPGGNSVDPQWVCDELRAILSRHADEVSVPVDPDIAALRQSEPRDMRRLRWLLAMQFSGSNLYRDDGEYSDSSAHPFIDFRRDSIPEIERKMRERNTHRAKAQETKNG